MAHLYTKGWKGHVCSNVFLSFLTRAKGRAKGVNMGEVCVLDKGTPL